MSNHQKKKSKADILIVDDTPANLRLLSKMLGDQGYKVRPVPEGSLAIAAAKSNPPDLILLDIKMPNMDGYEVCQHLKGDKSTRDIPVLFISALDQIQDKVTAFSSGGVDYITKPFQFEEVLARVEIHLELRRLQKQLQEKNRKMEMELTLAGKVQKSFLPSELPEIAGWQLSFELLPARDTSGDFYDIFLLPDGQLGIIIADVVDKGVGAALFMALCYALLRTFVMDFPTQPEQVFKSVNQRILDFTTATQFLTIFYGILDLKNGEILYSNAGHCPPVLVRNSSEVHLQEMTRTGVPLGILTGETWEKEIEMINPSDILVIYTDGITESENQKNEFFGEEHLKQSIVANKDKESKEILGGILTDVKVFSGEAAQYDDITLGVIKRNLKG
jgi:serine phosphatase RsbU (regulator of sigma subunit)